MEKKFTKGEWAVHHDGVYLDQKNVNYDDRNVADIICHPPDKRMSNASYKKWKYNAKLIAAAPEMLEALESFVYEIEKTRSDDNILEESYHLAKEAIKKATE